MARQCELLCVNRSTHYYKPLGESEENLAIMKELDKQFILTPFYGVRRMTVHLRSLKYNINEKRTRRLMRLACLNAIYCKRNLSKPEPEHKIYPYLLRGVAIERVNQVWSTDITYIPMTHGFMYLSAVIDWRSRYIISWKLSNSLHIRTSQEVLHDSLALGKPEIFNTDQGSQFTSPQFTSILDKAGIAISMDGKGRALDNIFIERFWRTLKYEEVFIHSYDTVKQLREGIRNYINFYNKERFHQSLDYKTPYEVYTLGLLENNKIKELEAINNKEGFLSNAMAI